LSTFQKHVQKQINNMENSSSGDDEDTIDIDTFLQHFVECPCQLIWDGDITTWSTSAEDDYPASSSIAKVILGGGLAPHRRLPEQFAWTLTRFVEKEVSAFPQLNGSVDSDSESGTDDSTIGSSIKGSRSRNFWQEICPIPHIFAPGTLLVSGRMLATTIIYLSIARVTIFQYQNMREINLSLLNLSKWKIVRKTFDRVKNIQVKNIFAVSLPREEIMNRIGLMMDHFGLNGQGKDLITEDVGKEDTEDGGIEDTEDVETGVTEDIETKVIEDVEIEDNIGRQSPTLEDGNDGIEAPVLESPKSKQPDDLDDKIVAPKSDSRAGKPNPNSKEKENGGNNPLLQKLLFFDQIIS
jgi:hypothetical protein